MASPPSALPLLSHSPLSSASSSSSTPSIRLPTALRPTAAGALGIGMGTPPSPVTKSLPARAGFATRTSSGSKSPGSVGSGLWSVRRKSESWRRDCQFAFYERNVDLSSSENSSDSEAEEDPESCDCDQCAASRPARRGRDEAAMDEGEEEDETDAEEKSRQRRKSLGKKKPVIVLRSDNGWTFSQDAFFNGSWHKDLYSLSHCHSPLSSSAPAASSGLGRPYRPREEDHEADAPPPVADIVVGDDEARMILP